MTVRPTVAVAFGDGFYGASSRAGYANRSLLRTLAGVLAPGVRLVALPVYLASDSPARQAAWHQETLDICERAGVIVRPVSNGRAGFGDGPTFRNPAPSAAWVLLDEILPCADPVAVIFCDVSFLDVAPLLPVGTLAKLVVVPRSTGLLHDPANQIRIQLEQAWLYHLADHGGWIAAISGHMREHLVTDYGLPADALVDLPDGGDRDPMRVAGRRLAGERFDYDRIVRRFLGRIEPSIPLSPRKTSEEKFSTGEGCR
jgi:hypothetical protein